MQRYPEEIALQVRLDKHVSRRVRPGRDCGTLDQPGSLGRNPARGQVDGQVWQRFSGWHGNRECLSQGVRRLLREVLHIKESPVGRPPRWAVGDTDFLGTAAADW